MPLPILTINQFLIRLQNAASANMFDFSRTDLRRIPMSRDDIRGRLERIARRAQEGDPVVLSFAGADVSGRDFGGLDLRCAIFAQATAEHAIFTGCDLSDVEFDNAHLDFADMRKAKLHYTKLHNSSIEGINFAYANLATTYGLHFREAGPRVVERLSVCGSIQGAILPPEAELLRPQIEKRIEQRAAAKPKAPALVIHRAPPDYDSEESILRRTLLVLVEEAGFLSRAAKRQILAQIARTRRSIRRIRRTR